MVELRVLPREDGGGLGEPVRPNRAHVAAGPHLRRHHVGSHCGVPRRRIEALRRRSTAKESPSEILTSRRRWGAGGATSEATTAFVKTAHSELGLETCMHLTCTNMPVEMVNSALKVRHSTTRHAPTITHPSTTVLTMHSTSPGSARFRMSKYSRSSWRPPARIRGLGRYRRRIQPRHRSDPAHSISLRRLFRHRSASSLVLTFALPSLTSPTIDCWVPRRSPSVHQQSRRRNAVSQGEGRRRSESHLYSNVLRFGW